MDLGPRRTLQYGSINTFIQDNLGETFNLDVIARAGPHQQDTKAALTRAKRTYQTALTRQTAINNTSAIIEMKVPEGRIDHRSYPSAVSYPMVMSWKWTNRSAKWKPIMYPKNFLQKRPQGDFCSRRRSDLAVGVFICTIDTSVAPAPKTEVPASTPKAPQEKAATVEAKKEEAMPKGMPLLQQVK